MMFLLEERFPSFQGWTQNPVRTQAVSSSRTMLETGKIWHWGEVCGDPTSFGHGSLRNPNAEEIQGGTLLTTRLVHDSRVRNGRWITRTRYVAREFKGACRRNSTSCSPTSGIGSRLVVMLHICFNWFASFLDLKDACLLVPQQEPVLVKKPTWCVSPDGTDDGEFWSSQVASNPLRDHFGF